MGLEEDRLKTFLSLLNEVARLSGQQVDSNICCWSTGKLYTEAILGALLEPFRAPFLSSFRRFRGVFEAFSRRFSCFSPTSRGVGIRRERKNLATAAELLSKEAYDAGLRQNTAARRLFPGFGELKSSQNDAVGPFFKPFQAEIEQ